MAVASARLALLADILAGGGVVGYPTEAVYGLGCDPFNPDAFAKLLALKQRPLDKGVILLAHDPGVLAPYLDFTEPAMRERVLDSWPGPHTWVIPCNDRLPSWITGGRDTVAVRVTAHPAAAALCRAWGGPLVSTSANPSGGQPWRRALPLRKHWGDALDGLLVGPVGGLGRPTTIRDARSGELLRN